jgi:hypothetical protein
MKNKSNSVKYLSLFVLFLIKINALFITISILNSSLTAFKPVSSHKCGLDYLQKRKAHNPQFINSVQTEERYLSTTSFSPLRIHLDYSLIKNELDKYDSKDLEALEDYIMPKAKKVFENILQVKKKSDKKLTLDAKVCDDYVIPEELRTGGEGVDADMIIFVLIDNTGYFLENEIEAAAIHCLQDSTTNRPLAGYIQFKPKLDMKDTTSLDYLAWLAIHEMSHIIAMNDGLYGTYVDDSNKIIGKENVIEDTIHPVNGKKVFVIKTPKVLETGRKHFNCKSLKGVPLEYNGGAGTAGAHWSKKIMNTDYMIGDSYGENLISEITLALFEDSGWYKVDYSKANLFLWGKEQGCSFFNLKCVCDNEEELSARNEVVPSESYSLTNERKKTAERNKQKTLTNKRFTLGKKTKKILVKNKYIKRKGFLEDQDFDMEVQKDDDENEKDNNFTKVTVKEDPNDSLAKRTSKDDNLIYKKFFSRFPNEFCSNANQEICSRHHIFRGTCSMRMYKNPLPSYEQYFDDDRLGGIDNLTDRCPIAIENKGSQYYYGGSCRVGIKRNSLEKICPECACFTSTLQVEWYSRKADDKSGLNKRKVSKKSYNKKKNKNKDEEPDVSAMCFKFECKDNGKLYVQVKKTTYLCNDKKGIKINGYTGKIMCPDPDLLCHDKFKCKFGCTEKYSNDKGYEKFDDFSDR